MVSKPVNLQPITAHLSEVTSATGLPVEGDLLRLDLPVLDIDLVTAQHYRNVLAHPAATSFVSS